jgi:uncharacterized membrane protein YoaK (UPF0700 family)
MRAPFYGLAFAAGYLDAISFLRLGNVFTANMTANTALLGIILGEHVTAAQSGVTVAPQLIAMLALVAGAFATAPLVRGDFDTHRASLVVIVEAVLVAVAAVILVASRAPVMTLSCVALLSAAMGAQSVLAVKAGRPGVSTAYATGTVATAIMRTFRIGTASQYGALAVHDAIGLLAYFGGAVSGAALLAIFNAVAFVLIVAVFLLVATLFRVGRGSSPNTTGRANIA